MSNPYSFFTQPGAYLARACRLIRAAAYGEDYEDITYFNHGGMERAFTWLDRRNVRLRDQINKWYHNGNDRQKIIASALQLITTRSDSAKTATMLEAGGSQLQQEMMRDAMSGEVPYTGLVTTSQGWSIWKGGAYDTPLDHHTWHRIMTTHLAWVLKEVAKENLSPVAIDVVFKEMVLPEPTGRKLPLFNPPQALGPEDRRQDGRDHNIARLGWLKWKRESGGNEAMRVYSRASMERWQRQHEEISSQVALLGRAETVLRYASLQEPALRLAEKLTDYAALRNRGIERFHNIRDALNEFPGALNETQKQRLAAKARAFRAADAELMGELPDQVVSEMGQLPSLQGHEGMGVAFAALVPVLVKGGLAIGLLTVVVIGISKVEAIVNDPETTALERAAQENLASERARLERQRQAELLRIQESSLSEAEKLDRAERANRYYDQQVARINESEERIIAGAQQGGMKGMGMGVIMGMVLGGGGLVYLLTRKK